MLFALGDYANCREAAEQSPVPDALSAEMRDFLIAASELMLQRRRVALDDEEERRLLAALTASANSSVRALGLFLSIQRCVRRRTQTLRVWALSSGTLLSALWLEFGLALLGLAALSECGAAF